MSNHALQRTRRGTGPLRHSAVFSPLPGLPNFTCGAHGLTSEADCCRPSGPLHGNPSESPAPRGFPGSGVAQILNLLYRGFATRSAAAEASALEMSKARPIANRQYSRVPLCANWAAAPPRCGLRVLRVRPAGLNFDF